VNAQLITPSRTYRAHIQMTPLFDRAGQLTGFRAIERKVPAAK
jgi:hypothetical protein